MTEKELIGKVHSAVYHQCQRRGYATPVDVLMEIGVLPKQKYEDWRFGRIELLQAVGCKKEKWAGTQASDSAAVQQKRKSGN